MLYALDFSHWKRKSLQQFFSDDTICFVSDSKKVPEGASLAVWGMRDVPEVLERNLSIIRIEDGFLRSVGLGADLIQPLSWIADQRGIYFNAKYPSDLEILLANTVFEAELLSRASVLKNRIVNAGFTKYNTGTTQWQSPKTNKRIILVPGQVESDASIAYGAPEIKTNLRLLQTVRASHPDAYVVYKPHPDVVAGLRAKGKNEEDIKQWCDEVVIDAPMGDLLLTIDEVHCLTSLTGFEALLRGKRVTCYGQPFYAGWGLTTDIVPLSRRVRHLTLEQLIAGALILYPRYMSRTKNALITPEEALNELAQWHAQSGKSVPWWRKVFRIVLKNIVGVR